MPIEKVRKVLQIVKEPLSLEMPIGDENESHLGDLIEDKDAIQPIDATIQSDLRETTTRVLASLTPREERIIRMRFGLGMNSDHTLQEVGQQFLADTGADSTDRGKGNPKAQPPKPINGAKELPRQVIAEKEDSGLRPQALASRRTTSGRRNETMVVFRCPLPERI